MSRYLKSFFITTTTFALILGVFIYFNSNMHLKSSGVVTNRVKFSVVSKAKVESRADISDESKEVKELHKLLNMHGVNSKHTKVNKPKKVFNKPLKQKRVQSIKSKAKEKKKSKLHKPIAKEKKKAKNKKAKIKKEKTLEKRKEKSKKIKAKSRKLNANSKKRDREIKKTTKKVYKKRVKVSKNRSSKKVNKDNNRISKSSKKVKKSSYKRHLSKSNNYSKNSFNNKSKVATNYIDTNRQNRYFAEIRRVINENKIYPQSAINRGIMGSVTIEFTVSPSGNLVSYSVVRGNRLLKKATIDALIISFPLPPPPNVINANTTLSVDIGYNLY